MIGATPRVVGRLFPGENVGDTIWLQTTDGKRKTGDERDNSMLLRRFSPNPSQHHWPEALMSELRYCVAGLSDAVAKGRKFRLRLVS